MDPPDTFYHAVRSVWGRTLSCGLAILVPYLFLGLHADGIALLPIVVVYSVATGWGILVYPFLLIFYAWFLREESSFRYLIVPLVVSGIDLFRVVLALGAAFR